jgi:hypothetical protein
MVAGFIPEQWPASNRNPWPTSVGIIIVVTLIVVGVLLWAVNTYIPMDRRIKQILNIVIVIAVVLWLLQAFGVLSGLHSVRVG